MGNFLDALFMLCLTFASILVGVAIGHITVKLYEVIIIYININFLNPRYEKRKNKK